MRFFTAFAVSFIFVSAAFALSPREQLVGSWYFKRGIGQPCNTLILDLEYHFEKDGGYSTRARMKSGGEHRYKGTYSATDSEATAVVDGKQVGPYPYSINNGVLRITQPDNNCDVELVRE